MQILIKRADESLQKSTFLEEELNEMVTALKNERRKYSILEKRHVELIELTDESKTENIKAPPEKGTFFMLQVYKRVGIYRCLKRPSITIFQREAPYGKNGI
ncbi:hypothetical protein ACROYT_G034277 [Oculina patagonica]